MSYRPNFSGSSGHGRSQPDSGNRHYLSSRGGSGRGSAGARPAQDSIPEANIKDGLDTTKVIETMAQPMRPSALEDFPVENVKYVASYNWIDKEKPTIAVPGQTDSPQLHYV